MYCLEKKLLRMTPRGGLVATRSADSSDTSKKNYQLRYIEKTSEDMTVYKIIYTGFLNHRKKGRKVLKIRYARQTRTCDPLLRSPFSADQQKLRIPKRYRALILKQLRLAYGIVLKAIGL
jgi:hypothetical protein